MLAPPWPWKNYVARVGQLTQPGRRLAGFFYYGEESEPPPYPLTEQKADEIFGELFQLETSELVADSLAIYAGKEKWQEWRLPS